MLVMTDFGDDLLVLVVPDYSSYCNQKQFELLYKDNNINLSLYFYLSLSHGHYNICSNVVCAKQQVEFVFKTLNS